MISVILTFDLWSWSFALILLWSLVITPENFMMTQWWEDSEKGDTRTDGKYHSLSCLVAAKNTEIGKGEAHLSESWYMPHRVLHTLDVAADNCLTGDFRLARPHWNNMARLSCHAKYPNPLQMYGWVICFEINCTWKQMSHRVMFAYRCWPEI